MTMEMGRRLSGYILLYKNDTILITILIEALSSIEYLYIDI